MTIATINHVIFKKIAQDLLSALMIYTEYTYLFDCFVELLRH